MLNDEQHTRVDYSIGSAEAIIKHYSNKSGRPYGFYFADALIFRDTGHAGQTVVNEISNAYQNSRQNNFKTEPAWRLTLTNKCNFSCFFCHGEGLSADACNSKPDFAKIYDLILRGIDLGCDDFTFTGGEPLIFDEEIARILNKLNRHPHKPQITIVTNAMKLGDEIINAAKHYGAIKFNVSFHSIKRDVFQHIIRRNANEYETVLTNVARLSAEEICFTLNYVVLRNINDSIEAINEIVDYAVRSGATALKFLELLMIDKLIGFYPNYCDVRFVTELLKNRLEPQNSLIRRDEYLLSGSKLKIYIQRCRCRLGCKNCIENMDRIITPEGKYEPCFVESERLFDLSSDLGRDFVAGDELIAQMSERYGMRSPLIVGDPEYTGMRRTYFYETNYDTETTHNLLEANGWKTERIYEFTENGYRCDIDTKALTPRLLYKLGQQKDTPGICKIYSAYYKYENTDAGGATIASFTAPQGPLMVSKVEAEKYINKSNLMAQYQAHWQLKTYFKGADKVTVGTCEGMSETIVSSENNSISEQTQKLLKLQEISQLFPDWLESKLN